MKNLTRSIGYIALLLFVAFGTGCFDASPTATATKDAPVLPAALISYGTGPNGANDYHQVIGSNTLNLLNGSAMSYFTSDGLLPTEEEATSVSFDTIQVGDALYGKAIGRYTFRLHVGGVFIPGNGFVTSAMQQLLTGNPLTQLSSTGPSGTLYDPRFVISYGLSAQYTPGPNGFWVNENASVQTGGKMLWSNTSVSPLNTLDPSTGAVVSGWSIDTYITVLVTGVASVVSSGKG